MIATGLLAGGVAALLQLFLVAARATSDSRDATYATVLALQKIEELRAAPFDAVTETTEYLDARGTALAGGTRGALYERRWAVEPLPADPADAVAITVVVSRRGAPDRAVRLATIRTRRGE
ncbi:MAG: hypothetical protein HYY76_01490 [Acidobacteria bacterium]|nr:hypothetical protein [Acidobacteriota bacterium]